MPAWLKWISFAGTHHSRDATLQRKIVQLNAAAGVGIVTILVFCVAYLLIGNPALVRSGLVQLPTLPLLALCWWFNHKGWLYFARCWLFAVAIYDVALIAISAQGLVLRIHEYYLLFAVLPAIFFEVKQWRSSVAAFLVCISFFLFFELHGWPADPAMLQVAPSTLLYLRAVLATSCIVIIVMLITLSERSAARNEQMLQTLALTDALTGLPNRRLFRDALQQELAKQLRSKHMLAVAIADIDHFKQVNDRLGHDAGDAALCQVGRLMSEHLRESDLLARVGGEEFALILPMPDAETAYELAERMRQAVAQTAFFHLGQAHALSISIGVTQVSPGEGEEYIIKAADDALYRAKHLGRNRVVMAEKASLTG